MNALDILNYGDRDLRSAFADVKPGEWSVVGVTTKWTPKDMLAHLVSYELLLAAALEYGSGKTEQPLVEQMGKGPAAFNDTQVQLRTAAIPEELLHEYGHAHDQVMALVKKLGPEKLREAGTIPWYGAEYSLDDFIVYASYAHKREHLAELKQFLRRIRIKK